MSYTPVEIRHLNLRRGVFGYRRRAVDDTLDEIADSFEAVWRERLDLTEKVDQLESDLIRHRELEALLRSTLTSAERAAHDLKDQAKRECELVVGEARAEARRITRDAASERDRLLADSRRIRSLLQAALAAVADGTAQHEPRAA
jgi:cell division initiation protein